MLKKLAKRFVKDEQGLELSEYAIMIALLIMIAAVTIMTVGQSIDKKFQDLDAKINEGGAGAQ